MVCCIRQFFSFQLANLQYIVSINTDHLFFVFLRTVTADYFSKYSSQTNFPKLDFFVTVTVANHKHSMLTEHKL